MYNTVHSTVYSTVYIVLHIYIYVGLQLKAMMAEAIQSNNAKS